MVDETQALCRFCHQVLPTRSGVTSTIVLDDVEMWDECEAISPVNSGYICAREPKHPGDHVACGLHFHEIARWPREPAGEEKSG